MEEMSNRAGNREREKEGQRTGLCVFYTSPAQPKSPSIFAPRWSSVA